MINSAPVGFLGPPAHIIHLFQLTTLSSNLLTHIAAENVDEITLHWKMITCVLLWANLYLEFMLFDVNFQIFWTFNPQYMVHPTAMVIMKERKI